MQEATKSQPLCKIAICPKSKLTPSSKHHFSTMKIRQCWSIMLRDSIRILFFLPMGAHWIPCKHEHPACMYRRARVQSGAWSGRRARHVPAGMIRHERAPHRRPVLAADGSCGDGDMPSLMLLHAPSDHMPNSIGNHHAIQPSSSGLHALIFIYIDSRNLFIPQHIFLGGN